MSGRSMAEHFEIRRNVVVADLYRRATQAREQATFANRRPEEKANLLRLALADETLADQIGRLTPGA